MAHIMESTYLNLVVEAMQNNYNTKEEVRIYCYDKMEEEIGTKNTFEQFLNLNYDTFASAKKEYDCQLLVNEQNNVNHSQKLHKIL
jgi:hypothetical protein